MVNQQRLSVASPGRAPDVDDVALAHLSRVDHVLKSLIQSIGPFRLTREPDGWAALVSSVVYQQLSGAAAKTICEKIRASNSGKMPSPDSILTRPPGWLRAVGLTNRKEETIRQLASRVVSGGLDLVRLATRPDNEIMSTMTETKGVGPWTVGMFLVFHLGRMNVLFPGDLGLRNAIRLNYAWKGVPTEDEVERHGEPWAPYRTVASWYLWKSLPGFPEPGLG